MDLTDYGQHGEPCSEDGHVWGCTGAAGGEHVRDDAPDPSWSADNAGYVEPDHPADARWNDK